MTCMAYVVEQLCFDVILGNDFLQRYQAQINFKDHTWSLQYDPEANQLKHLDTTDLGIHHDMQAIIVPGTIIPPQGNQVNQKHITITTKRCNPDEGGSKSQTYAIDIQYPETLDSHQERMLFHVLNKRLGAFATNPASPPQTTLGIQHTILLDSTKPIALRPYRTTPQEKQEIARQTSQLLQNGIITETVSAYAAPVVLVKKADNTYRFCCDYRKLNEHTINKDMFPLPRIEEIFDNLNGSKYFTTCDLAAGYWHIPMKEEDKPKTAFITANGHFQWERMPFGLVNAQATFNRAIATALAGIPSDIVLSYVDDLLIHSKTFEQHIQDLNLVLGKLQGAKLSLKAKKCKFAQNSVKFLGHIISQNGIYPDTTKIEAVKSIKPPTSADELKHFLGMATYYRRFIATFAQIAEPLFILLRKNVPYIWSVEQQKAFQTLKAKLISPPILQFPDFNIACTIETDASDYAVGAALLQHGHPIAYTSRTLNKHERNYTTTEKETLAVIHALKQFRVYLNRHPTTVVTDHKAVETILRWKNPQGRIARWIAILQSQQLIIKYRPGKLNVSADTLSRLPSTTVTADIMALQTNMENKLMHKQKSDETFQVTQANDPECLDIVADIHHSATTHYVVTNGLLYRKWIRNGQTYKQLYVPRAKRQQVIATIHNDLGHQGRRKTYATIAARYYWHGLYADVDNYVQSCIICQQKKDPRCLQQPIQKFEPPTYAFERIGIDILGPLPKTKKGNQYILVVTEHLSRWVEAFALKDQQAKTIAHILVSEIICRFGAPEIILSDQGTNFCSTLIKEICNIYQIQKLSTTAYNPRCNGMTERFNKSLTTMLSSYIADKHDNWDQLLPHMLFAYRTSPHCTTNLSPYMVLFGRLPKLPIDVQLQTPEQRYMISAQQYAEHVQQVTEQFAKEAHQNTKRRQQTNIQNSLQKAHTQIQFKPGQQILVREMYTPPGLSHKLQRPWKGPYTVQEQPSPTTVKVDMDGKNQTVNASHVKIFFNKQDQTRQLPDDLHMVRLVQRRKVKMKRGKIGQEYQIEWSNGETTWETEENVYAWAPQFLTSSTTKN